MKKYSQLIAGLALLAVILSACGTNIPAPAGGSTPNATEALVTTTTTPDPCAPENLETEVLKVHKYMREFDDASSLAMARPVEQLPDAIADLQRIRREAEDEFTPHCLGDLKTYQIGHMNTVINTLIAMMSGQEAEVLNQGIAIARQQHDDYTLELARVLGLTIEPANVPPPPTDTPTP
jgi:hypothetical protein